jgi:hypothetical protein
MYFRRCIGCFVLLAAALFTPALPVKAQVPQATIDKIVSLMQQDHYDYKTTNTPTVFVIHFTGTHLKDIKVILALGHDEDSDLVVFVTLAEKQRLPTTADFRYMLLKMSHEFSMIKVGLDHDDDLTVRIDASSRLADATYLRHVVNQVKNSSDEIYGKIEPQLLP